MAPDPGSRGRRDNGLTAVAFLSVGDVDPRVGEHLLDVLYLNGIAAYLQPTVDYDAVTRAASLPRQPTDRLWADRRRADDARALVAAEAASAGRSSSSAAAPPTAPPSDSPPSGSPSGPPPAGPPPSGATSARPDALDEDAAWADIVAFFDQEPSAVVPPWPVSEDADEPRAVDGARRGRRHDDASGNPDIEAEGEVACGEAGPAAAGPAGASAEAATAEEEEDEEEDEEGYVPPPPPPLPRMSKHTLGALLTVAFGLFVLVLGPRLLGVDPDAALEVGILAIITGIGYLIWRMRDGPPVDDRPDDGAVV